MRLEDLEIYKLAREISKEGWLIYQSLDWRNKKVLGDQFITAIDSVGANVAEGWGRFHFADRNKFNYNARGSLIESAHWAGLLYERGLIEKERYENFKTKIENLHLKLNNYINSIRKNAQK